jgi:hypothetical protein
LSLVLAAGGLLFLEMGYGDALLFLEMGYGDGLLFTAISVSHLTPEGVLLSQKKSFF